MTESLPRVMERRHSHLDCQAFKQNSDNDHDNFRIFGSRRFPTSADT